MDAQEIIRALGLQPHPEGGYFVETYRSEQTLGTRALRGRYSGPRSASTAIYYLLTSESFSEMHRLKSDEVFHFYSGSPVEMLRLWPDGAADVVRMGTDLAAEMRPQVIVPKGVWQGSRLVQGGEFALLGCTVAPGFDYADYESGKRDELLYLYPDHEDMIRSLTRAH